MQRAWQIKIIAIIAIGIIAVIAIIWYFQPSTHSSLRDALGHAFDDQRVQYIELNLPPADGRYPGAVIVMPKPGQTLLLRPESRPDTLPDNATSLRVKTAADAGTNFVSYFIGHLRSVGDLTIDITLDDLRLFEADLNEVRERLITDQEVYRAEKNSLKPRVIVRTYEAILSLSVRGGRSLSAKMWEKAQDELVSAGGHIKDANTVVFENDHPTAIAYETLDVSFFANSLSRSREQSSEVELSYADAVNVVAAELDISAFNLKTGAPGIQYALLGNSRYRSTEFGNLRVVEPSIQIVESVFHKAGAESLITEQLPRVLNEAKINDVVSRITDELRKMKPSLFVLYYVGHAVTGLGGQLYLVLEDYNGDLEDDLGEDFLLGLPRAQLDNPASPLTGKNIGNLLDVVTALQAEAPLEVQGLYPVSTIAKQLEKTGIPFIILIDACFEHKGMDHLRNTFNLTESGDYYGPDDYGGPQEVERYADAIRQFGTPPYLHSTNVVIFSATPGTIAVTVQDPRPQWDSTYRVGPLARRIYRRFEATVARSEPISWGDFLYTIVDVKGLGVRRIQGTVSWSDFSAVRQVPMLQRQP